MATVSGYCVHPETGAPGAYQVFANDYYTGELLGATVSDETTGAYSITVPDGARVRVTRVNADLVTTGAAMVLALPLDGTGTTVEETVGGYTVTGYSINQDAVAGSPAGRAAIFDSNSDYILVAADSRLAFTDDFEVGFWVYHDSIPAAGDYFFWSGDNRGGISFLTSGVIEWYGVSSFDNGTIGTLTAGTWNHIVLNREAGYYRAFLNGVQTVNVISDPGTFGNGTGTGDLGIGRWPGSSTTAFRGKISGFYMTDAAIHTEAFTPSPTIPVASSSLGAPFAGSEVIDYVEA